MKKSLSVLLVMVLIWVFTLNSSIAAVSYGNIPTDVLPPNGWINVQWNDPGSWQIINVGDYGLLPNNDTIDASQLTSDIIDQTSGNRIIYFPEGTYFLKSRLEIIDSNIILKGDGIEKTQLLIDTPASDNGTIMFTGDSDYNATLGVTIPVTQTVELGDNNISVEDSSGLSVGDHLYLYLKDGLEHWGTYTEAQIVDIIAINGNDVTLDMKVGLQFDILKTPVVQKLQMTENVGIQDMLIHRTRAAETNAPSNIEFKLVYNAFVKNVESSYSERAHVITRYSKNVVVENFYAHHSFSYGEGGQGYGIEFCNASTSCRATNNKLWTLRHHLMAHLGANHNVFSYNSLEADYNGTSNPANLHGDYAYNNLFESNWFAKNGVSDGYWGAEGPRNMWFRNYSGGTIGTYDPREGPDTLNQVVVGNVMKNLAIDTDTDYIAMNRINGTVESGSLSNESDVPNSMYIDNKPDFFGTRQWPLYGPNVTSWGDDNTLPAYDNSKTDGVNYYEPSTIIDLFTDSFHSGVAGTNPTGWIVDETYGTVTIEKIPSASNKSMKLTDTSKYGGVTALRTFNTQGNRMSLSFDMMMPSVVSYFNMQLREESTGTSGIAIFIKNGNLAYRDRSNNYVTLQSFNANTWYNIKVVADIEGDVCDIFVNDVLKATQVAFRNPVTVLDAVKAGGPGSNQGSLYLDNISIYQH